MEKIKKYRQIIQNLIQKYSSFKSSYDKIEDFAVCDEKTDNYILLNVGWHPSGRRQLGYPIHIRIKDEKVWVEWDGTDQEVVEQLINAGIDENDIVLGFQSPKEIRYSDLKAA